MNMTEYFGHRSEPVQSTTKMMSCFDFQAFDESFYCVVHFFYFFTQNKRFMETDYDQAEKIRVEHSIITYLLDYLMRILDKQIDVF